MIAIPELLLATALLSGAQRPPAVAEAPGDMTMEIRIMRSKRGFANEPDPQPQARPSGVLARAWQSWIRPADVPEELRMRRMESTTQLLLDIDASGQATGCRVVAPSPEPRLDALACALLPRRGRFEPAYLAPGRPVAGRWLMAVMWDVRSVAGREEEARNARPAIGIPPRLPGSTTWPRLAWVQHVRPEALPSIESDYPAAAQGREGVVSLELAMSGPAGVTGCTIGVGAGDLALDEAACRVARRLDLRYADPCDTCFDDPLPLQVVWRKRGSHIRLPLPSRSRHARAAPLPRDPADDRTATFFHSFPQPLPLSLSRADFRSLPIGTLTNASPSVDLSVDEEGRVTGCRIRRSTGSAKVDARICELLQERQRYTPATDIFGDPVPATTMRWFILYKL